MLLKNFGKYSLQALLLLYSCIFYTTVSYKTMDYNEFFLDTAAPCIFAVNLLNGKSLETFSEVNVSIFGRKFPSNMMTSYMFQLPGYLAIPFFCILGLNTFTVYFISYFFGLLYIILLFFFLKLFLPDNISALAAALIGTSPSYIHYSGTSFITTETFINFFFLAGIFLFLLYARRRRAYLMLFACLSLGAGFSIKLSYLPRFLALLFAAAAFFRKETLSIFKQASRKLKLFSLCFFLLGAGLFIIYNLGDTPGKTSELFIYYIVKDHQTLNGVDNRDISGNLATRLKQAYKLIINKSFDAERRISYISGSQIMPSSSILFFIFAAACICLLLSALKLYRKDTAYSKLIFSIFTFYILIFLSSLFSPKSLREYQISILFPFHHLVMAMAAYSMSRLNIRKTYAKYIAAVSYAVFCLIPLSLNIIDTNYMIKTREGLGYSFFSPTILNSLYSSIKEAGFHKLHILVNENIDKPLEFISRGELEIINLFPPANKKNKSATLTKYLNEVFDNNDREFLFLTTPAGRDEADTNFIFFRYLKDRTYSVKTVKKIRNSIGNPLWVLTAVSKEDVNTE